ncbi:SRPBCC family protein [Halococcoides cellulosivorans]|uniref:SRPBCC family protein n=1 Tax=Halococcoides cellulosivorans TaxID=1679096 RepID=UPI00131F3D3D|nr:SRPBCC family protein [Halococcoides cellulosivorans]
MIVLDDSIAIDATPADIAAFVANLDANYTLLSDDHIHFASLTGDPTTEGATFCQFEYFRERIVGGRYLVESVDPERRYVFAVTGPRSLLGGRLEFSIEPTADGVVLTERLELGYSVPLVSAVVDRLVGIAFADTIDALRAHQREGLENFRTAIETGTATLDP